MERKVLKKSTKLALTLGLVILCLALLFLLDKGYIGSTYIIRILRLSVIYALIGVSMNLVNGFTGVFSLGQAGFMAIGAYMVGIFTIPVEERPQVYYLFEISDKIANVEMNFFVALILGGLARCV